MKIAIVGLGVAGGAAAVALARAGRRVTVFEQAANPGPVGTGFLLQPSGRAALANFGLMTAIEAHSWPIRRFVANKAPGRRLTELGMSARGVARGVLFSALLEAAIAAGAEIRSGVRVTDFSETGTAVKISDAEGRNLGEFDLAVVADGGRSALREKLNPGLYPKLCDYGALWAIGRSATACPEELRQETRGTRILSGLLPVSADRQTFFWGAKAEGFERLRAAGFPAFVRQVGAVFPEAVPVLEDIGGFESMVFARYGHARPRRLFSRRLILIGDAAHAMSPHLGQGANLGLLDALALTRALSESDGDPARAFPAFVRQRSRQNLFYGQLSRCLGPTFQSDHDWLGTARDLGLPVMSRIPPLRRVMESTLSGARGGWLG